MKKSILFIVLFAFIATFAVAQPRMHVPFNNDTTKYVNVISLPIGMAYVHLPNQIEDGNLPSNAEDLDGGYYLFKLSPVDSLIITTDAANTKAKIVKKSRFLGVPFDGNITYNIKDDERRMILYYESKRAYFGYIYDKTAKACQYFSKKPEFRHGMRRFGLRW
jgi:hypothetical protein